MTRNSELEKDSLNKDREHDKTKYEMTALEQEMSALTASLQKMEERVQILTSDKSNVGELHTPFMFKFINPLLSNYKKTLSAFKS